MPTCGYNFLSMGLPGGIIGALAAQGVGQGSESREAVASLARAIAALHSYLDTVRDPKSRATATQCLARLEQLRGDHMPTPQGQAGSGGSAPGGPPGY